MNSSDPLGGLGSPGGPASTDASKSGAPKPQPAGPPRVPVIRTPSTWILLAVLSAFFLAQNIAGQGTSEDGLMLFRMGANNWVALLDGDWWRVGSYSFLHIGAAHFLLNAWALWIFMRPIEASYGAVAALGIYAIAALAGGVASTGWAMHEHSFYLIAAGASGGIAGLFGAQISLWARVRKRLPPDAARGAIRALLLNLGLNVVISWQAAVNGMGLDNAGHVGGIVAGVLFGFVAPLPVLGRRFWSRPAQILLIAASLALFSMEGAAVARAVNPHPRVLRGSGVVAEAPWLLVPAIDGTAVSPGGIGMEARIYRSPVPLDLTAPGGEAIRLGDRTWVKTHTTGLTDGDEMLAFSSAEGTGSVRVEVLCGTEICRGKISEDAAVELARTFRLE